MKVLPDSITGEEATGFNTAHILIFKLMVNGTDGLPQTAESSLFLLQS